MSVLETRVITLTSLRFSNSLSCCFCPFARDLDVDDLGDGTFREQVVVHHSRPVGVFFEWRGSVKAWGELVLGHSLDLIE